MTTEPTLNLRDQFAAHHGALGAALPASGAGWLAALRDRAFADFAAKGVPTPKTEEWKYTNLAPLAKFAFVPATPVANGVDAAALPWVLPRAAGAHRLAVVNGRFRPDLSAVGRLPAGVELGGLAAALEAAPDRFEGLIGRVAPVEELPLLALNTALSADGFVLRLGRGVALEAPVELLFVTLPGASPVAFHPRGLVLAEAGSQAVLIEQHVGIGDGTSFANHALEIELESDAALRHYKLQAEGRGAFHIATNTVRVGRAARYDAFTLSHGGRLARNESRVALDGSGAECRLDGAYMGRARQHIDNTTFIDHVAPNTTSRETFKGVLEDYARGVFQGRILVRPNAQKADGQQQGRALLLSPGAEVDTKPQLEIYADDVKCSHGAAAGELDGEALFYLRSRGIPEHAARRMLVEGFLVEVVDAIRHEAARERIRRDVAVWIGDAGAER